MDRKAFLRNMGVAGALAGVGSAMAATARQGGAQQMALATDVKSYGVNVLSYFSASNLSLFQSDSSGGNYSADIQAAINDCLATGRRVLYFPAGRYCIGSTLTIPSGRLSIVGEGRASEIDRKGGTTLLSTSGQTILKVGTGTRTSSNFLCEGVRFESNATSGALVVVDLCPATVFRDVEFFSIKGADGLELRSAYTTTIQNVSFNPNNFTATPDNGSAAIRTKTVNVGGVNYAGGLLKIADVNVGSGFSYGILNEGAWQQIAVENSEILGKAIAIYMKSPIDQLLVKGCYFEGVCDAYIADYFDGAANAGIRNLFLEGCFFFGSGLKTASSYSAAIQLSNPSTVSLSGYSAIDLAKSLLNIVAKPSGWYSDYNATASYVNIGGVVQFGGAAPSFPIFRGVKPAFVAAPCTKAGVVL